MLFRSEYLEKITQDLMEVNKLLCDKQAGQPIFLREGPRIVRLRQEDILYMEGYGGDYVKVHRTDGKPILSQVSLNVLKNVLAEIIFVVCTVLILFRYLILIISNGKESVLMGL